MKKPLILFILAIGVLVACIIALLPKKKNEDDSASLTFYCAAGLQKPVSEIVKNYEKETHRKVKVIYNGSGALLSQLKIAGGDLYLPANDSYLNDAKKDDLTAEIIPVATVKALIVVASKNPKNIHTLNDLAQPGIRISLGNNTTAIGKFTRQVLKSHHLLEAIEKNTIVTKPTVNDICKDVALGTVDATIAWDSVAQNFPELQLINNPPFSDLPQKANISILKSSKNPTAALHFARYLAAKDKGLPVFKKYHFQVSPKSDVWADTPEVVIFSGSMLRPAIEKRIHAFEKREGCKISTTYDGCGSLVSAMKAGAHPSFYFSCDVTFLDQVQNRFEPRTIVTKNEIILLVPKNNPKHIHSLDDLLKKNIKVGLAHPVKSALGKLTRVMLEHSHHLKPLEESGNIIVMASKGDELVTQMQAGALDAALLYRSNALASESIMKHCTIIPLNRPDAIATQPFATALDTPYPQLLHRLGDYLSNDEAKKSFLRYGFQWAK